MTLEERLKLLGLSGASTDPLAKTQNSINNYTTRLNSVGYQAPQKASEPWWAKVLKVIDTPRNAIATGLANATDGGDFSTGFGEGLRHEKSTYGSQFLDGVTDNKILKTVLGFGVDVALDPLTYASLGLGSFAKGLVTKSATALGQGAALNSARDMLLNQTGRALNTAAKAHNVEGALYAGANTSKDLVNGLHALSGTDGALDTFKQALTQENKYAQKFAEYLDTVPYIHDDIKGTKMFDKTQLANAVESFSQTHGSEYGMEIANQFNKAHGLGIHVPFTKIGVELPGSGQAMRAAGAKTSEMISKIPVIGRAQDAINEGAKKIFTKYSLPKTSKNVTDYLRLKDIERTGSMDYANEDELKYLTRLFNKKELKQYMPMAEKLQTIFRAGGEDAANEYVHSLPDSPFKDIVMATGRLNGNPLFNVDIPKYTNRVSKSVWTMMPATDLDEFVKANGGLTAQMKTADASRNTFEKMPQLDVATAAMHQDLTAQGFEQSNKFREVFSKVDKETGGTAIVYADKDIGLNAALVGDVLHLNDFSAGKQIKKITNKVIKNINDAGTEVRLISTDADKQGITMLRKSFGKDAVIVGDLSADGTYAVTIDTKKISNFTQEISKTPKVSKWQTSPRFFGMTKEEALEAAKLHGESTGQEMYIMELDNLQSGASELGKKVAERTKANPKYKAQTKPITPENTLSVYRVNPNGTDINSVLEDMTPTLQQTLSEQAGGSRLFKQKHSELSMSGVKGLMKYKYGYTFVPRMMSDGSVAKFGTYEVWKNGKMVDEFDILKGIDLPPEVEARIMEEAGNDVEKAIRMAEQATKNKTWKEAYTDLEAKNRTFNKTKTYADPIDEKAATMAHGKNQEEIIQMLYKAEEAGDDDLSEALTRKFMELGSDANSSARLTNIEYNRKEYGDILSRYMYEQHNKIELRASLPDAVKEVEDAKAALATHAPGDKGIKQLEKNLRRAENKVASINKQIKKTEVSINKVIDARHEYNPNTTPEEISKLKKDLAEEIKNGHESFLKANAKNDEILKPANDMARKLNELDVQINKSSKLVSNMSKAGKDASTEESKLTALKAERAELKAAHTKELADAENKIKSQHVPANREERLQADHQGLVDMHANSKKTYEDMLANDEKARDELMEINSDARELEGYWERQGSTSNIRDRYISSREGELKSTEKILHKMRVTGEKPNDSTGSFEDNLAFYERKAKKLQGDIERYKAVTPMTSKQELNMAKKAMDEAEFNVKESEQALEGIRAEKAKQATPEVVNPADNTDIDKLTTEMFGAAENVPKAAGDTVLEPSSMEQLVKYGFKDLEDFKNSTISPNDYSDFAETYKEMANIDPRKMDAATKILENPEMMYSNELMPHEKALRAYGVVLMDRLRQAGMKEHNIQLLGDLLDDYIPHTVSWEKQDALAKKFWQGGLSGKKMTNINLNSFNRQYKTTIAEANMIMEAQGYGANYFETNIAKAYLTRMTRHNKVVYDQRYLDRLLGNLGVEVSNFSPDSIKEAYNSLKLNVDGSVNTDNYIMVVPKTSIKLFGINRAGTSTLNSMIDFIDESMKLSNTSGKMRGMDTKVKEAYDSLKGIEGELDRVIKENPEAGAAVEGMLGLDGGDLQSVLKNIQGLENISSADYAVIQRMAKAVESIPRTVTKFRDTKGLKSTLEALSAPFEGALTKVNEESMGLLAAHVENVKAYLIPEEVYNFVNKTAKGQLDEGMNILTKTVDTFNKYWKVTVTSMIPSFHLRNFFGGMQQNAFEFGIKCLHPKFMKASLGIALGKEGVVKLGGKEYTYSGLRQLMAETRVNTPFFKTEANELGGMYRHEFENTMGHKALKRALPWNVGRDVGNATEIQLRATNFMAWLDEGVDASAAAERTKSVMFDYTELSDAERKVFKRIMPFYTFFRKNFPYQLENILNRPGQYGMIQHAVDNAAYSNDYDMSNAPEWLTKSMALPLGKNASGLDKFANLSLPAGDAFGRSIKDIVTGLNPLAIAPMELYANKNFLTGAPITRYPGQTTDVGGVDIPNEILHAMQKVGVIRNGMSAMSSSSDDPAGMFTNDKSPLSPMSAFGLIKGYDEKKGELNAAYEQDRELANTIQMLKDKGVDVPTVADTNKVGGVTVRALAKAKKYSKYR